MTTFTLVVPTYGRPQLLRRLLTYYDNQQFAYPIIIADSSKTDVYTENQKTVDDFSDLTITHQRFDPSTEIYRKITDAMQVVRTPFMCLCSDDDYLAIRAVNRCIAYLNTHDDYSAAEGHVYTVEPAKSPYTVIPYPQRAVENESPADRVREYFKNPTANFYAVYRTAILREIFLRIARYRTENTRFEELAVSILGAIAGKVAKLPKLHMVRQSSRNRTDSGSRQTGGWVTVMESPTFTANKERFLALIIESLVETGVGQSAARQLIQTCFDVYLGQARGNVPRPQRITLVDRIVATALSPITTQKPRVLAAYMLRSVPFIRVLRSEFIPIAQLISRHPDGIDTRV